MDKNDVSFNSFNQETSFIIYKKVPLLTPEIQAIYNQQKSKLSVPSFFYDKYTNQFLYTNGEIFIIIDTKCKLKSFSRINVEEKIKNISVEYNNKYMLLTTIDYKLKIFDLQESQNVDFPGYKKFKYIGGFFINYKRPEKNHNYFIVCLMIKDHFRIKRISKIKDLYSNSFKYLIKSRYISNKLDILNYDFNPTFKILLIIKLKPISFVIFNLKSKSCCTNPIVLNIVNIKENEYKLYLQQIYKKLYLIYLDNKNSIIIYRLNNLRKIKNPRRIKYSNKEDIMIKSVKLQFYNNLIILYMPGYIKIYDIKRVVKNFELSRLNISNNEFNIFINANFFGKYLLINEDYYKIKFSKQKYLQKTNIFAKDTFFILLRRKNSNLIIKEILFEHLNNFTIWKFFDIVEEIIINQKKFIKKMNEYILDDKNDPYTIINIGNNQFFLTEDYLLSLFNQYFDKRIKPEMLIKALCYMFHLYEKYNFNLNINLFYASLCAQLNKVDDIKEIEFMIKNKIIPINENMGIYFIMKAKSFKDKKIHKKFFNLGFDILMNECTNFDNNLFEIIKDINNDDYLEFYEVMLNILFQNCN